MSNEMIVYVVGGLVWIIGLFIFTRPKSRGWTMAREYFKWTLGIALGFLAIAPIDLLPFTSWDGVLLGLGAAISVVSAVSDGERREQKTLCGADKEHKSAEGE
jgi:hypothetical protein